jgi:hypothetical protein
MNSTTILRRYKTIRMNAGIHRCRLLGMRGDVDILIEIRYNATQSSMISHENAH